MTKFEMHIHTSECVYIKSFVEIDVLKKERNHGV